MPSRLSWFGILSNLLQFYCKRHGNYGHNGNNGHFLPPSVDPMDTMDTDILYGQTTRNLLKRRLAVRARPGVLACGEILQVQGYQYTEIMQTVWSDLK